LTESCVDIGGLCCASVAPNITSTAASDSPKSDSVIRSHFEGGHAKALSGRTESSCAGLTRASIDLFGKQMDCRAKPGNDDWRGCRDGSRTSEAGTGCRRMRTSPGHEGPALRWTLLHGCQDNDDLLPSCLSRSSRAGVQCGVLSFGGRGRG